MAKVGGDTIQSTELSESKSNDKSLVKAVMSNLHDEGRNVAISPSDLSSSCSLELSACLESINTLRREESIDQTHPEVSHRSHKSIKSRSSKLRVKCSLKEENDEVKSDTDETNDIKSLIFDNLDDVGSPNLVKHDEKDHEQANGETDKNGFKLEVDNFDSTTGTWIYKSAKGIRDDHHKKSDGIRQLHKMRQEMSQLDFSGSSRKSSLKNKKSCHGTHSEKLTCDKQKSLHSKHSEEYEDRVEYNTCANNGQENEDNCPQTIVYHKPIMHEHFKVSNPDENHNIPCTSKIGNNREAEQQTSQSLYTNTPRPVQNTNVQQSCLCPIMNMQGSGRDTNIQQSCQFPNINMQGCGQGSFAQQSCQCQSISMKGLRQDFNVQQSCQCPNTSIQGSGQDAHTQQICPCINTNMPVLGQASNDHQHIQSSNTNVPGPGYCSMPSTNSTATTSFQKPCLECNSKSTEQCCSASLPGIQQTQQMCGSQCSAISMKHCCQMNPPGYNMEQNLACGADSQYVQRPELTCNLNTIGSPCNSTIHQNSPGCFDTPVPVIQGVQETCNQHFGTTDAQHLGFGIHRTTVVQNNPIYDTPSYSFNQFTPYNIRLNQPNTHFSDTFDTSPAPHPSYPFDLPQRSLPTQPQPQKMVPQIYPTRNMTGRYNLQPYNSHLNIIGPVRPAYPVRNVGHRFTAPIRQNNLPVNVRQKMANRLRYLYDPRFMPNAAIRPNQYDESNQFTDSDVEGSWMFPNSEIKEEIESYEEEIYKNEIVLNSLKQKLGDIKDSIL